MLLPGNTNTQKPTFSFDFQSSTDSFISERERDSLYAVARPSVVCLLSVTLVHPTQAVAIFGNFSTAFGTLDIP